MGSTTIINTVGNKCCLERLEFQVDIANSKEMSGQSQTHKILSAKASLSATRQSKVAVPKINHFGSSRRSGIVALSRIAPCIDGFPRGRCDEPHRRLLERPRLGRVRFRNITPLGWRFREVAMLQSKIAMRDLNRAHVDSSYVS